MSCCNQLAAWFLQQRGSCWLGFSALPVLQLFICFKYWGRIDWRKCTWSSSSCVRHAQTYVTAYQPSFNRYPSSSCMFIVVLKQNEGSARFPEVSAQPDKVQTWSFCYCRQASVFREHCQVPRSASSADKLDINAAELLAFHRWEWNIKLHLGCHHLSL